MVPAHTSGTHQHSSKDDIKHNFMISSKDDIKTDFRIFMIIKLTADNVVRDSILLYFPKIQFSYKERKKDKT